MPGLSVCGFRCCDGRSHTSRLTLPPCTSPRLQAVSKAAKTLQDSGLRGALDAQLEDAELRRLAAREAEKQERERQWRVAKGLEAPSEWGGWPRGLRHQVSGVGGQGA